MAETTDKLDQAMHVATETRHVVLAVVDETGTPHLVPVEECRRTSRDRVVVRAWVDIPTVPNGGDRRRLALLLWDEGGSGFQLTGAMVRLQEAAVLDGLAEVEQQVHFPQLERTILMHVDSVEEFHFGPVESSPSRR